MISSITILNASCELQAKCLSDAPMPLLCIPLIIQAALFPASSGSSEKYSKFLPHTGERLMFVPGPRITETFSARHSCAMACPSSYHNFSSQEQADVAAGGKQVVETVLPRPIFVLFLFLASCFLSPFGPSVIMIFGKPSSFASSRCQ